MVKMLEICRLVLYEHPVLKLNHTNTQIFMEKSNKICVYMYVLHGCKEEEVKLKTNCLNLIEYVGNTIETGFFKSYLYKNIVLVILLDSITDSITSTNGNTIKNNRNKII